MYYKSCVDYRLPSVKRILPVKQVNSLLRKCYETFRKPSQTAENKCSFLEVQEVKRALLRVLEDTSEDKNIVIQLPSKQWAVIRMLKVTF